MDYVVPRLLANPHLQTLGAALPIYAPAELHGVAAERAVFPLGGGGALVGRAWWQAGDSPRTAAVLLHGVGGTSESRYLVRAAIALHRAGLHVVRMSLRGVGDGVDLGKTLYHAGLTADPAAVLAAVAADPRVKDVLLVGFSCGGTVTLKLAAEWGDAPPAYVRGVAAVSAPLDLGACAELLGRAQSVAYRTWVVRNLVSQAVAFAKRHPDAVAYDVRAVQKARTIQAFDAAVIVPTHGFASVPAYYDACSPGPLLGRVRVPTLLVHAEDDPLVPGSTVRPSLEGKSSAVDVAWSARGGHVAWLSGLREEGFVNTWPIARLLAWLDRR